MYVYEIVIPNKNREYPLFSRNFNSNANATIRNLLICSDSKPDKECLVPDTEHNNNLLLAGYIDSVFGMPSVQLLCYLPN